MTKIIECPRDAMQGIKDFIPTEKKIKYINQLLKVGYDTLDFGSFVSPKAIPQMADTKDVLSGLDLSETKTKLLAIIANERGAKDAAQFEHIDYFGYPFSISETFQKRNTNVGIAESFDRVKAIQDICVKADKEFVVYISMAFGNPYGDPWGKDEAGEWIIKLSELDINIFALADTVGTAKHHDIHYLFSYLQQDFPENEFGAHFHTNPNNWIEKVDTAFKAGCRRFDTAIKGFGGCPMAEDDLVGNLATENLLEYLKKNDLETPLNQDHFSKALHIASEIF